MLESILIFGKGFAKKGQASTTPRPTPIGAASQTEYELRL
jgi:hypothetical protein